MPNLAANPSPCVLYFLALALASVNGPNFRGSTHNVLILQIREIYM